jgi:hypothetical protein
MQAPFHCVYHLNVFLTEEEMETSVGFDTIKWTLLKNITGNSTIVPNKVKSGTKVWTCIENRHLHMERLNPSNLALHEKLIVTKWRNLQHLWNTRVPCAQNIETGFYSEWNKCSPQPMSLKSIVILSLHLGLYFQVFSFHFEFYYK